MWNRQSPNYSTEVSIEPAGARPGPDLTMVVPTYNERDGIAQLARAVFAACAAQGIRLELVIVDDNSPDGTGAIAESLTGTYDVRVIHRSGKLGLGTAVVEGFAIARADVVGVMDADFSHPPALVPRMLMAFQATGADIVVASRYVTGGSTPDWPLSRRLLSRAACLLARPITPIRDAASGFFLIRKDIARGVTIKAGGFKICLELLVRGRPKTLVELPYRFDDREAGESKMSLKEAAGYLFQLRALYWLSWTRGRGQPIGYQRLTASRVDALTGFPQPQQSAAADARSS
jgi:dolichol-phosphate mannosyltransferase